MCMKQDNGQNMCIHSGLFMTKKYVCLMEIERQLECADSGVLMAMNKCILMYSNVAMYVCSKECCQADCC